MIVSFASTPLAAQVKFHTGETSELYKLAHADESKLIFVDLYASWCPPCKMMERNVFSREDVGEFMSKNFISAKYSVDDKIGGEFSRTYGVQSIPTYLIFNSKGELKGRMTGGMTYTEFVDNMKKIIAESKK